MKKRTSVFARLFAVLALVVAIVAVFVIVSGATDESDDGKGKQEQTQTHHQKPRTKAATYEVKPGDTLTRISHLTGIPVRELVALNPETDPQILIEGEILRLR